MFKNETELDLWCLKLGFQGEARKLIDKIRSSPPARLVQSSGKNVIGQFPSGKMKRTLQFESHRCELCYLQQMERDDDVLEIWDQPLTFNITYKAKSGRVLNVLHTPDFFVCRNKYAEFIECKTEEDLIKLAEDKPNRFSQSGNSIWRCPPGEIYAERFGFRYTIHSTDKISRVYIRNLVFLDDYYRTDGLPVSKEAREYILAIVREHPGISLSDLLRHTLEAEI